MKASAILLTSLGSVDMTISVCLNSLFYNCQKYSSDKFSSSKKDYLNAKAKPRENVKKTETVCILYIELHCLCPKRGEGSGLTVSRKMDNVTNYNLLTSSQRPGNCCVL